MSFGFLLTPLQASLLASTLGNYNGNDDGEGDDNDDWDGDGHDDDGRRW